MAVEQWSAENERFSRYADSVSRIRAGRELPLRLRWAATVETDTAPELLIRRAESTDIDALIELAWANVEEGKYKSKIIYDQRRLRMYVGAILGDDRARFFVWDAGGQIVGMFAFTLFANYYYFAGQTVANMVIWSVAKEFRGRKSLALLEVAEREALDMGAKYMLLTGPGEKFGALTHRLGYEYLESSHIKVLA